MSAGPTLRVPAADGGTRQVSLSSQFRWQQPDGPPRSRVAYAATHVAADPTSNTAPGAPAILDWDTTLAFRRHLWSWGLGVAEAMDTAQRGMGLDWPVAAELVRRTAAEAHEVGGAVAAGVGTDQAPLVLSDLSEVIAAYEEQLAVVEEAGVVPILMASRQLAAVATGPDDYAKVYDHLLGQVSRPAILHWLGPMFDPALEGYWGGSDVAEATDNVLAIIADHADRVAGIKVSLLDADHEIALRRRLPHGVALFTGDDFNYPELVRGDDAGYSDALLGIFDPIAPVASTALQALDEDDLATYDDVLAPTVTLARHLFEAPTYHYKTGIVFLAWLAGHQPGFTMVGGMAAARGLPHLVEAALLADAADLFPDPEQAAARLRSWLQVQGVGQ